MISVLATPTGPTLDELKRIVRNLKSQWYDVWELIILIPKCLLTREIYSRQLLLDPSHKVRILEHGEEDRATVMNRALAYAVGELVFFMSDPIVLSPQALFYVAETYGNFPRSSIIYTDSDQIENGRHNNPHFRPDFDEDLFISCDPYSSTAFFRRNLICELGGIATDVPGAELFDLFLRCMDREGTSTILHIPHILLHEFTWPQQDESLDRQGTNASQERLKSIERCFHRRQIAGKVEVQDGVVRVRYPLPMPPPKVSIIVPTRDHRDLLERCLETLFQRTDYPTFEVIVIDNGSREPACLAYLQSLSARSGVTVLRDDGEFNFSRLNNTAAGVAEGEVLVLLNDDVEIIQGEWLNELVSQLMRDGVGAVGARLWYPDFTLQHGGVVLGIRGVAGHVHVGLKRHEPGYFRRAQSVQSFSAVTAACMAVRRSLYHKIGGLDERLAVAFNDVDFCIRLRETGARIVWTPYAELIHHESVSRGKEDTELKQLRFEREIAFMIRRWGGLLDSDPAYNLNLCRQMGDFSFNPPVAVRQISTSIKLGHKMRQGLKTFEKRMIRPILHMRPWDFLQGLVKRVPPREEAACLERDARYSTANRYLDIDNWQRAVAVKESSFARSFRSPERVLGLSVIILTRNKPEFILPLVDQLKHQSAAFLSANQAFEILIGDTGSTDELVLRMYRQEAGIHVSQLGQYHFSANNNTIAFEYSRCSHLLFLNNDIQLPDEEDFLFRMLAEFRNEDDLGCMGTVMHFPDGKPQHLGIAFFKSGEFKGLCYHHSFPAPERGVYSVPAVTGAFLLTPAGLFCQAGGMEELYRAECQDVDYCLKLSRMGYRSAVFSGGRVIHFENGTREKGEECWPDRRKFLRTWATFVEVMF